MKVRFIVCMPGPEFMQEKESNRGYWGFVRSKHEYEKEKRGVSMEMNDLIDELEEEGYELELLPLIECPSSLKSEDVYKRFKDFMEAPLNIVFPFSFPRLNVEVIVAASRYLVIFDKFKPNTYSGTLFAPPMIKDFETFGFTGVLIVEGSKERLKKVIRAIYSLEKIKEAKPVVVGPINSGFGGNRSLKKGIELFGYTPIFYTYDEFVKTFNKFWEDEKKLKEARKIVDRFVKNSIKVVEPTEEKLIRAAVYHLVLESFVEENGSDWVTVNCLSQLIRRVGATPCMSFALMNDSGVVATCEADPTMLPLHYLLARLASKPSFFFDPTVNEGEGTLILAHCTSPTMMLGYDKPSLKYEVRTHHESNTGATVKPFYESGSVTILGFNFDMSKMLIVRGDVVGSPDLRICRSQVELKVKDAHKVLENWQGFHWVMVYGDYTEEAEIIAKLKKIEPIIFK